MSDVEHIIKDSGRISGKQQKELLKEPNKRGMHIQQLDPYTKEVIATFDSITTTPVKNVRTSAKSIKKGIANDVVCSGYRWKLYDSNN